MCSLRQPRYVEEHLWCDPGRRWHWFRVILTAEGHLLHLRNQIHLLIVNDQTQEAFLRLFERRLHISHLLLDDLDQKRGQLYQGLISRVRVPGLYTDAVLWLQKKVLCQVVHNNSAAQIPSQQRQILYVELATGQCVLPVQSVVDRLLGHCAIAYLR